MNFVSQKAAGMNSLNSRCDIFTARAQRPQRHSNIERLETLCPQCPGLHPTRPFQIPIDEA